MPPHQSRRTSSFSRLSLKPVSLGLSHYKELISLPFQNPLLHLDAPILQPWQNSSSSSSPASPLTAKLLVSMIDSAAPMLAFPVCLRSDPSVLGTANCLQKRTADVRQSSAGDSSGEYSWGERVPWGEEDLRTRRSCLRGGDGVQCQEV